MSGDPPKFALPVFANVQHTAKTGVIGGMLGGFFVINYLIDKSIHFGAALNRGATETHIYLIIYTI